MPFIFVIICFTEVCRKCGIFINIKSNGGNGNEGYNWGKSSIRKAANQWKEALLKMRAGGVDIVATYVFWIHHEEKKGEWDFSGSRDLRAFLELCKRLNMPVWLRIGPWAHGECRNGGFPDWLVEELGDNGLGARPGQEKQREARTNDELYMKRLPDGVERLCLMVRPFLFLVDM